MILYEMLSGKQAFNGAEGAEVMSAILRKISRVFCSSGVKGH
jgi:hypothetical protein